MRKGEAAEAARIELAKALLRLEAMPRLEADLGALRMDLDKERQGRVAAEQQAAVLAAKLEAANERTDKAEVAIFEAVAQARKHGEAVFTEAAKVEAAKNTGSEGQWNGYALLNINVPLPLKPQHHCQPDWQTRCDAGAYREASQ